MRLGFVNIYPWRPHIEQTVYLATQTQAAGHDVFFLTCRGALPNCYAREIRGDAKVVGCTRCRLGGLDTYTKKNVTPIDRQIRSQLPQTRIDKMTFSSAATLTRIESPQHVESDLFRNQQTKLTEAASISYENAKKWITDNKLEAVIGFNGRMDATRAIFEACRDVGIRYVSHERGWFGDGLHIVPDGNCLSLRHLTELVAHYAEKPLTAEQADQAAEFVMKRLSGGQTNEWRLYNLDRVETDWPDTRPGPKVLLIPSSSNEFIGHPERKGGWPEPAAAMSKLIQAYQGLDASFVLRAHPNWNETVGKVDGKKIDKYYRQWAKDNGVLYIEPASKASTQALMQQSDCVILANSSAGYEAGFLGKRVVSFTPSQYSGAQFVEIYDTPEAASKFNPMTTVDREKIVTGALRYVYAHKNRYTQFPKNIIALSSSKCAFIDGNIGNQIADICRTGKITPSDERIADNVEEERRVVDQILDGNWRATTKETTHHSTSAEVNIKRLWPWRIISSLRELLPPGDRQ